MKYLLYFLISVCVCALPAEVFAQSFDDLFSGQPALELVEKPVTTTCVEDRKCLDLENYKRLLLMRTQYVWLFKVHTQMYPTIIRELKRSSELNTQAADVQGERAARAEKAYDELFPAYLEAVQEAEEAKAHSVWGGGMVWLVVAGTTGVVAGIAAGVWLAGNLGE